MSNAPKDKRDTADVPTRCQVCQGSGRIWLGPPGNKYASLCYECKSGERFRRRDDSNMGQESGSQTPRRNDAKRWKSPGVPEPKEADRRRAKAWWNQQDYRDTPEQSCESLATLVAAVRIEAGRDRESDQPRGFLDPQCFDVDAGKRCTRYLAGAEGERKEIVEWLRWEADHRPSPTNQRLRDAADAIEGGEHLRPRAGEKKGEGHG